MWQCDNVTISKKQCGNVTINNVAMFALSIITLAH